MEKDILLVLKQTFKGITGDWGEGMLHRLAVQGFAFACTFSRLFSPIMGRDGARSAPAPHTLRRAAEAERSEAEAGGATPHAPPIYSASLQSLQLRGEYALFLKFSKKNYLQCYMSCLTHCGTMCTHALPTD